MLINERLKQLNMSKYRLSKTCGVPQATINDICSGKTVLAKCAAGTLFKVGRALGLTVEEILQSSTDEYRCPFETFKSNTCHHLKDMGDLDFMLNLLKSDEIRALYNRHWYPEALYLLAMLDYLSRINDIPLCTNYDDLRRQKLQTPLYPAGVLTTQEVFGTDTPLHTAERNAIPEFYRFNIMEAEVRDVV